jgi:hypothetical protein
MSSTRGDSTLGRARAERSGDPAFTPIAAAPSAAGNINPASDFKAFRHLRTGRKGNVVQSTSIAEQHSAQTPRGPILEVIVSYESKSEIFCNVSLIDDPVKEGEWPPSAECRISNVVQAGLSILL